MKYKTFFLVSQVLSVRLKKQTSENAVDSTFNHDREIIYKKCSSSCKISFLLKEITDSIGHVQSFLSQHNTWREKLSQISVIMIRNIDIACCKG